ncbi:hypothetical protein [Nesterenkonia sp. K-15-9-6]|uniref:hypothetical protein n=1 Tax=Nesterenkonia sp. K-15-9-6 TaxID=3093918 RepID=UPI004043A8C9
MEIEPGTAVLFGDGPCPGLDLQPFELVDSHARQQLSDSLAIASGLGNLGVQAASGAVQAQGLVQLAPETVQALKAAQPMTSGGWNLGALKGANGEIVAQVRWAPASGAQAASVMAALGPAAALLGLQMQLALVSRRVDENLAVTREILEKVHEDQWATMNSLFKATTRAVQEAQAAGAVTDHIFAPLETKTSDLIKQRDLFTRFVQQHIRGMAPKAKDPRAYIQQNMDRIEADLRGMLMAEASWHRTQVLRAGRIARDVADSPENECLLAEVVATTRREHGAAMDKVADLLDELESQCGLLAELPGGITLPFTAKRRDLKDAARMARELGEKVAELGHRMRPRREVPDPDVQVFRDQPPEKPLRILRWLLPDHATLLALAEVGLDRRRGSSGGYLGVTAESLFLSSQNALLKEGTLEWEAPLRDIRYVRFTEREKQGPVVEIITVEENIAVEFDSWAGQDDGLDNARRLSHLLKAAMNLPEEERTTDPLLQDAPAEPSAPELAAQGPDLVATSSR